MVPTIGFYLTKPPRGPSNRLPRRQTPATPHLPLCTPSPIRDRHLLALSLAPPFQAYRRSPSPSPCLRPPLPPSPPHPALGRHYPVCSLSVGRGCAERPSTLLSTLLSRTTTGERARQREHARALAPPCIIVFACSCMNLGQRERVRCNFLVGVGNYIIAGEKERDRGEGERE